MAADDTTATSESRRAKDGPSHRARDLVTLDCVFLQSERVVRAYESVHGKVDENATAAADQLEIEVCRLKGWLGLDRRERLS